MAEILSSNTTCCAEERAEQPVRDGEQLGNATLHAPRLPTGERIATAFPPPPGSDHGQTGRRVIRAWPGDRRRWASARSPRIAAAAVVCAAPVPGHRRPYSTCHRPHSSHADPAQAGWPADLTICGTRPCPPGSTPGPLRPRSPSGQATASMCCCASTPGASPDSKTRPSGASSKPRSQPTRMAATGTQTARLNPAEADANLAACLATATRTRPPAAAPTRPRSRKPLNCIGAVQGLFRRSWQVLGSNQRRLSRRFYSEPIPAHRNTY